MSILSIPPFPHLRATLKTLSEQWTLTENKFKQYTEAAARLSYAIGLIENVQQLLTPVETHLQNATDQEHINLFTAFRRLESYFVYSSDTLAACTGPLKQTLLTLQQRVAANIMRIKLLYVPGNLEMGDDFRRIFKNTQVKLQSLAPEHLRSAAPIRAVKFKSLFCCIKKPVPFELNYADVDQSTADLQIQHLLSLSATATFSEIYQQVCCCLELFATTPKSTDVFVNLLLTLYINLINCCTENDYNNIINSHLTSQLQDLVITELETRGTFVLKRCICAACNQQLATFSAVCTDCNTGICQTCYDFKIKYFHTCSTRRLPWASFELLPWAQPTDARFTEVHFNKNTAEIGESTSRMDVPSHGEIRPDELKVKRQVYYDMRRITPDSAAAAQAWRSSTPSPIFRPIAPSTHSRTSPQSDDRHTNNPFFNDLVGKKK